jgi:hypothetical protein
MMATLRTHDMLVRSSLQIGDLYMLYNKKPKSERIH